MQKRTECASSRRYSIESLDATCHGCGCSGHRRHGQHSGETTCPLLLLPYPEHWCMQGLQDVVFKTTYLEGKAWGFIIGLSLLPAGIVDTPTHPPTFALKICFYILVSLDGEWVCGSVR